MRAGEFAALIAPVVERVFRSAMAYQRDHGGREVVMRYGGPPAVGALIMFRHSLGAPGRLVTWPQFAAVLRYDDVAERHREVKVAAGHGAVAVDDDGIRATEHGRRFLEEAWSAQAAALRDRWSADRKRVEVAAGLLERVLAAAADTGGDAYAAMWPTYEPPVDTGALLLNRLGILRYHRADAHARAWSEAGLTAEGIVAMAAGPERDAIEETTNALAGAPYEALSADERLALLGALGALP